MISHRLRLIVGTAGVGVVIAAASSCGPSNCFDQLSDGGRYRVIVGRGVTSESDPDLRDFINNRVPACGSIDGIVPGASFSFWLDYRAATEQCEVYDATVRYEKERQDIPGVMLLLDPPLATNVGNFRNMLIDLERGGSRATTSAGCDGSWGFNIKYIVAGGDFFLPPGTVGGSPLLLERWFIPKDESTGICPRCSDTFAVHLERIRS